MQAAEGRSNPGSMFIAPIGPGFTPELPYRVCLVRLDEGVLLVSNLVGDTSAASLGARLRVVFERATADIQLPKFRLSQD